MNYLPLHIINFSTQFRMGFINAPSQFVMNELNAAACPAESISYLPGLFNEESDLIFIGFTRFKKDEMTGFITIFSEDIESIHPLSSECAQILPQLIEKELIVEPVEKGLREKLISFRNSELAGRGSAFLMRLFGVEDVMFLDGLGKTWFNILEKYSIDQNFPSSTLPEYLMTYERTKNFHKNGVGILEDTASLIKQFYGLPDGYHPQPLMENGTLFPETIGILSDEPSSSDPEFNHFDWVYSRLKKVANLRMELLDRRETDFITVLQSVNANPVVGEFNKDLRASRSEPERWFQVIMIYLQLRLKIREGIQGDNAVRFWFFVKDFLIIMPKETITALYLAGIRFGINEFVPLFVFVNHPPLSRIPETSTEEFPFETPVFKPTRNYWNDSSKTVKFRQEPIKEHYKPKKQTTRKKKEK